MKELHSLKCAVSDCGRDVSCKGLCNMHYGRVKRHGTTEKIGKAPGGHRIAVDWEKEDKHCLACGAQFNLMAGEAKSNFRIRKTCSEACRNRLRVATTRKNGGYHGQYRRSFPPNPFR